jgi:hypothetical protein
MLLGEDSSSKNLAVIGILNPFMLKNVTDAAGCTHACLFKMETASELLCLALFSCVS